jgi:site-specific DNA recombinase
MDEWKAARKPIEQRLSMARRQIAKVSRSSVLDAYVGNGNGLRAEWEALGSSAIALSSVSRLLLASSMRP